MKFESAKFETVVSDWQMQFPVLSRYTPPTLFAKSDIILIGLRIDKVMSDEYRLILEILPLWEEKKKISIPVFYKELYLKNGGQFFIEYRLHGYSFEKAVECAKQQFGCVLQENIRLNDIFGLIDSLSSTFATKHNPIDWHRLFELKLALAIYYGGDDLVATVKAEIEKETKYWDEKHFNRLFEKSIDEWKNDLYRRMENRELFMKQVQLNMNDKRISRLKRIHISPD